MFIIENLYERKKIKVIYNFVVGIESGESQNFWKGELLTLIDRAIVPRG